MAIDIITISAPLGAGNFAMHFCGDAIDNQTTFKFHVAGLVDRPFRDGCRKALFGEVYEAPQPVVHSEFTKALAAYLRDGAARSRSEPKPATTARSQDGASSR